MKMFRLKNVSFFCFLLVGLFFLSCEEETAKISKRYTGPVSVVKDFDAKISDSGRIKYIITSDVMEELQNGDRVFPQGMIVETKDNKQRIESTLQSDSAYFVKEKQLWILKKNVELNNVQNNEHLYTDELFWDMKKSDSTNVYVKPSTHVKIRTTDQVVQGFGLKTSQNFEEYEILNITGIFDVEDEEE